MNEKKVKVVFAVLTAALLVIIFITTITVYADLYPPLKNWLKNTFTHHWIGKGVLSFILFVVAVILLSIIPFCITEDKLVKKLWFLFWITVLATAVVFTFYLYETFPPSF